MFPQIGSLQPLQLGLIIILGAVFAAIYVIQNYGIQKIRATVIKVAEFTSVLSLSLSTIAGIAMGYGLGSNIGQAIAFSYRLPQDAQLVMVLCGLAGAAIGAVISFVVASLPLALLFVLVEISVNTRRKT